MRRFRLNGSFLLLLPSLTAFVLLVWTFSSTNDQISIDPTERWDTVENVIVDGNVTIDQYFGTHSRNDTKTILFYTKWVKHNVPLQILNCPKLKHGCLLHSDRSHISDADSVVFHAPNIPSEINKHYYSKINRTLSQRFVFFTQESPENQWGLVSKMIPENFFNWTMTYSYLSDVPYPYGGEWITREQADETGFTLEDHSIKDVEIGKARSHSIFGAISNCDTPTKRKEFIIKLNQLVPVTLIGKCAFDHSKSSLCPHNQSINKFRNWTNHCIREQIEDSYFFLALENSICSEYITEKYWERVYFNSVPILWTKRVFNNEALPPKSAIFVDDFKTMGDLAKHLNYLIGNSTAYAEYHQWRKDGWQIINFRPLFCNLCQYLWNDYGEPKMYKDPVKWFNQTSKCNNAMVKRFL